jgi:pimeloyl-ACP methyl ester carboxylesterase/DNA-binding CsgD family transcriptional regulator
MDQRTSFLQFESHRIAYASVGDGPVLVMPAWWVSHVVEDWTHAPLRHFVQLLAQRYRVVRYDRLGTGLSDRVRPPHTLALDFEVAQLEALIEQLGGGPVTLFGISSGGPCSAVYAARHPDAVERIVFYGSYADGQALGPAEARAAMVEVVRSAWGLGSRMLVDVFAPSVTPAERRALAGYQRAASTPEIAADLLELGFTYDVRDSLAQLAAPALVVHRERDRAVPYRQAREIAGLVPGAELVALPGDVHLPWHGDVDALVRAVSRFLRLPAPRREPELEAVSDLSAREKDVLRLVGEGLSDGEIAERLVLSPHTVHRHVANIRRKLGLRSRSAAAVTAARAGLI